MIYKIISQLESTSSRNEKIAILQKHKTNTLFQQVVKLALDPLTNFYIRKIPKYRCGIPDNTLDVALSELSKLSSRQITGNSAIDFLRNLLCSLDEQDAVVLERVIQKDLKCGVAVGVVNAAWDNFISEYPCMLACQYDQKIVDKIAFPAYVQLKLDGMRFNAIVRSTDIDATVEYRSRNGKEIIFNNPELDQQFIWLAHSIKCDNVVFDGELLVSNDSHVPLDRQTGNGILNKAIKGTISDTESKMIRATVWDYIPLEHFVKDVFNVQYGVRFKLLEAGFSKIKASMISLVETHEVASIEDAWKIFEEYLVQGQEGIILKTMQGKWENKRSKGQIKFKAELDCDLIVKDYQWGTGKYDGMLGALICESADSLLSVGIGSGFTDEQRKELTPHNTLGKIVAVRYNAKIKNKNGEHSLFLPRVIEIREDKDTADTLKKIK